MSMNVPPAENVSPYFAASTSASNNESNANKTAINSKRILFASPVKTVSMDDQKVPDQRFNREVSNGSVCLF